MTSIAHISECPNCGEETADNHCSVVVWVKAFVVLCITENKILKYEETE